MLEVEQQIYGEIIEAYVQNDYSKSFEYHELIKLMNLSQYFHERHEIIQNTVKNALILLIALFFKKNDGENHFREKCSKKDQKQLKILFEDVI
jgi:hypothetical protein